MASSEHGVHSLLPPFLHRARPPLKIMQSDCRPKMLAPVLINVELTLVDPSDPNA